MCLSLRGCQIMWRISCIKTRIFRKSKHQTASGRVIISFSVRRQLPRMRLSIYRSCYRVRAYLFLLSSNYYVRHLKLAIHYKYMWVWWDVFKCYVDQQCVCEIDVLPLLNFSIVITFITYTFVYYRLGQNFGTIRSIYYVVIMF